MAPPTALPLPDSEILHPVSAVIPTRHRKSPSKQLSNPHFSRHAAPKTGRSHASGNRPALKPRRSKAAPAPHRRESAPLQGRTSPTPADLPLPRADPIRKLSAAKKESFPTCRAKPGSAMDALPHSIRASPLKKRIRPHQARFRTQTPPSAPTARWDKIPTQQPNPTLFRPVSPTEPEKTALLWRSAPASIGKQTFPQALRSHFRAKPALPRADLPHFCGETVFPAMNRPPLLWENPYFFESISPTLVARLGTRE